MKLLVELYVRLMSMSKSLGSEEDLAGTMYLFIKLHGMQQLYKNMILLF